MNQKNRLKTSVLAIAVALSSSHVYAAGFQLNESSASGLGRAFSGEGAIAEDATSGSRNPATMMRFSRPEVSGGATFVDPDVHLYGNSPAGSDLDIKNIAPTEWIPNLHFVMPINEQFAVGASATSNFGLATDFPVDYPAGPLAGKTDLKTVNLNLSGAYRLNQHFSFGLGFNAVYADAKITRHAGELALNPQLAATGLTPSSSISRLEGDKWGYGWNAGIMYELDEDTRFGFTYRSKVDIKFKGNYRSDISSALNPAQGQTGLPWGTDGNSTSGSLKLNLPEIWELSAYHRVDPKWAVHYSMAYTSWTDFQELKATDNNGNTLFYKEEGYRDSYRLALGTTYYHDKNWTFRTGIAFDDSPVPANKRTISIPDQDRFWLSAGTTYAFNDNASVDLGVSYMHGQQVDIDESGYAFSSKGSAWLYGANLNYKF